jgi:branched-chain amino acid aminotransferase
MKAFDYTRGTMWLGDGLVSADQANLSVMSAAVLYGLSVYTVFPVNKTAQGMAAFRLADHYKRLEESAHIMGIDAFPGRWTYKKFVKAVSELVADNKIEDDVLVRASVHVVETLPGTRSRGLRIALSMFIYPAIPILPQAGARLKTSVWRRVPDNAMPARAKVNGAYANSVLGKQDAIDSGYDDCIFLDGEGHVCELSAANLFLVKHGKLITPGTTNDILEGINRKTIIELAQEYGIEVVERTVDLTEVYVADEAFACGTSAFVAPIIEVDARQIGGGQPGPLTKLFAKAQNELLHGNHADSLALLTSV